MIVTVRANNKQIKQQQISTQIKFKTKECYRTSSRQTNKTTTNINTHQIQNQGMLPYEQQANKQNNNKYQHKSNSKPRNDTVRAAGKQSKTNKQICTSNRQKNQRQSRILHEHTPKTIKPYH